MAPGKPARGYRNLVRQRRLHESGRCLRDPRPEVRRQTNSASSVKGEYFPSADRREPDLISWISQFLQDSFAETPVIFQAPEPNVGIEKQVQSRKASQSCSSLAGETMSPRISNVPFMEPIQSLEPG